MPNCLRNSTQAMCTTVPKRVVRRDAGAEEGRCIRRREIIGDTDETAGWSDHRLGITAVHIDTWDAKVLATDQITSTTGLAMTTVSTKPAHADACARLPPNYSLANLIDDTRDLMTGDNRIRNSKEQSIFCNRIAMADAACFDSHHCFAASSPRPLSFYQLQHCPRLCYLNCAYL